VITGIDDSVEHPELIEGGYLFSLETRKLDDIRALGGNSPEDDLAFATVARVSEINQGVYSALMRPAVRAMATQKTAELTRRLHHDRLGFEMFADENPLMRPVAGWAEAVRAERRPARPDNPFVAFERVMSDMIETGLKMWGNARDTAAEAIFFATYGSPILQAMVGLRADDASVSRRIARDEAREASAAQAAAHLSERIDQGGPIEAAMRALIYVRGPDGSVDERGFAAIKEIGAGLPAAERVGFVRFKEIVKEQYLMLLLDEDRAIAALPKMLQADRRQSEETLAMVHRVLAARGALSPEASRRLAHVETLLDLPVGIAAERQPEAAAE
jgi:hypothetical protein